MEEWRTVVIDGVEYHYEVSSLGRVRNSKTGRILKPKQNNYDYLQVTLYYEGKQKQAQVHRLVAQAFLPCNDEAKTEVNHKNYNRHDNKLENLEWISHTDNIIYSKAKKVKCIETGVIYESAKEVERQLGYAQPCICNCCNKKYETAYGFHWEYVD